MPSSERTFVALHVTTTGPDPERDAVVALSAARFVREKLEAVFECAVRPGVDIQDHPTRADAYPLDRALDELAQFIGRDVVVGHDLTRGLQFLRRHGALQRATGYELSELADVLDADARDSSLRVLLERYSGPTDLADDPDVGGSLASSRPGAPSDDGPSANGPSAIGPKPASADAASNDDRRVASAAAHGGLYMSLCEAARNVEPVVLEAIVAIGEHASWSLAPVFRHAADHPNDCMTSAQAPAVPPPLRRGTSPVPIDVDTVDALIAPKGRLADEMAGFEDRAGQRDMLRAVGEAFNLSDQLLVEAGTGTGKSLAYLLPAAAFAQANGQPVVVATHTIALQDQLMHNDLPLVRRLLGDDLRFCVLKGRANYLCRTRAAGLHARQEWSREDVPMVARIMIWATRTGTGDRAELRLRPDERRAWRLVNADADACTSETCSHAAVGTCWVHRARGHAASAHVIVVNHALLVSDARVNNRLLPPHEHLIIDEAHHLESVATDAMGFSASRQRARQALGSRTLSGNGGLLARAASVAAASDLGDEVQAAVWESVTGLRALAKTSALDADRVFDAIANFLDSCDAATGANVRLTGANRQVGEWMPVEAAWDAMHEHAVELRKGIVRLSQALSAVDLFIDEGDALVGDLQTTAREIADIDAGLERAVVRPDDNDVIWATRGDGQRLGVHRAPLVVGEALHRWLFGDKETLILTSATLRTGDGFGFLRDRLALPDAPELVVESPFDFAQSTLLFTPTDIPPPGAPGYQEALDTALVTLASALGGRTLVLFTSHHGLRTTYHNVRAPLGAIGIRTLGQGLDGPRHALLERFRDAAEPCVLLGTRSFWEGIDVPGEALSGLVVARLPFEVPTDPVFAARAETFDDPFREYAVPLAVLRFRQGFGRLIRTQSDRGIVAVLDSRLLSKSYGHSFVAALPSCQRYRGAHSELAPVARRFLEGEPLE